ncbi:MAG: TadA family conjugal transfer-associated ATPase [Nocardioidaceae bacterium]
MSAPSSQLVDEVRLALAEQGAEATPDRVASALRGAGRLYGNHTVLALVDALRRDTVGAGPLESLLNLPGVTDVLVNGADRVYVDRGCGLELTEVTFPDDDAVRRLAQRLAAAGGRRIDDASPFVDVRLPDGTRFHAVLAPLARPGTVLSLRVPSRHAFSLNELREAGSLTGPGARVLRDLVRARAAFLVTGGTGSGKTTLLAALLGVVPSHERLVLVEDASELRPDHPHVVGLEGRTVNVEGAGGIAMRDLVREALRMRPDRLIVGEVRGAEVVELLAALNTGHAGGCGTVHANSAQDLPARIEALGVAAGLAREAVHSQLGAALDVVLHLRRGRDGVRRLAEVATLARDGSGLVHTRTAMTFDDDGRAELGEGAEGLDAVLARNEA